MRHFNVANLSAEIRKDYEFGQCLVPKKNSSEVIVDHDESRVCGCSIDEIVYRAANYGFKAAVETLRDWPNINNQRPTLWSEMADWLEKQK